MRPGIIPGLFCGLEGEAPIIDQGNQPDEQPDQPQDQRETNSAVVILLSPLNELF